MSDRAFEDTSRRGPSAGADSVPDPSITELEENYELIRSLGVGSMGEVWLARQRSLDRMVAIKLFRPQQQRELGGTERFLREGRYLSRLRHPNLIRLYEVGFAGLRPYLAMEYVEGEDLARRMEREGAMPPEEAVTLSCRILEALAVIHEAGLIHRDLKPANVLLGRDGSVKVADFGLARPLGGEEALTASGIVLGTPSYMPPEQAYGREPTAAWDLYALATMLYEMLAGELPFPGEDGDRVIDAKLSHAPPPLGERAAGIDPALAQVVDRAIHPHMDRRYPDGASLLRALVRARRGEGATADTAAHPRIEPRPTRRRSLLTALVVLFSLLLVGTLLRAWVVGTSAGGAGRALASRAPHGARPVSPAPAPARPDGRPSPLVVFRALRGDGGLASGAAPARVAVAIDGALRAGRGPEAARLLGALRAGALWRGVMTLAPRLDEIWAAGTEEERRILQEALVALEAVDRAFVLNGRPAPLGIRELLAGAFVSKVASSAPAGPSIRLVPSETVLRKEGDVVAGQAFLEVDGLSRCRRIVLACRCRGLGRLDRLDLVFRGGARASFFGPAPSAGDGWILAARLPRGLDLGVNRWSLRLARPPDGGEGTPVEILALRLHLDGALTAPELGR